MYILLESVLKWLSYNGFSGDYCVILLYTNLQENKKDFYRNQRDVGF